MNIKRIAGISALVAAFALAAAAVVFDPATGTGFVGKGDVQLAFGWNNKAAQDNANAVSFTYGENETMVQLCVDRDRGEIVATSHRTKIKSVLSSVAFDARLKNQYTGYNLKGFGPDSTTIDTGWVGEDGTATGSGCPEGYEPHGAPEISDNGSGLFVHFGDISVLLPPTPPAP